MTRPKEDDAFTVDFTLRNFPSVESFCVVRDHPLMVRDENLDPAELKTANRNEEKYSDDCAMR